MKRHQSPIGKENEWFTPKEIVKALGKFDLDVCTSKNRPYSLAKNNYTKEDDGLSKEWFGRVWCNPPFNRYEKGKWMNKMSKYNNGILLVPASCETKDFIDYVYGKCAGILFIKYRPHFYNVNGVRSKLNCGCAIALIAYGEVNLLALLNSNLGTVLIEFNKKRKEIK